MIKKRFRIEGIEDVKVFVAQNLDTFTVIVEEKIGYEWHPMVKNEFTLETGEGFDMNDYVIDAMKEFAKKKKIEEDVKLDLDQYEDGGEISIGKTSTSE